MVIGACIKELRRKTGINYVQIMNDERSIGDILLHALRPPYRYVTCILYRYFHTSLIFMGRDFSFFSLKGFWIPCTDVIWVQIHFL